MPNDNHSRRVATYDGVLERFGEWVKRLRRPDGSLEVGSPNCTASMPLPVYEHAVGDSAELLRSLWFIERRCREDAETFLHPANSSLTPYRAAWMVNGAILGEHLSLTTWLERWMMRFEHRETGGFFGTEAARAAGEGEICFDSTSMACAALCVSGRIAEAQRAGAFLRRIVESQPDPERRLLDTWDTRRGGLLTEFDPKHALLHAIEWAKPKQYLYKIGLIVRAFALLHARTGDAAYLELAESLQRDAVERSPAVWENTLGHKLAWSGYALAVITRKEVYVEQTCRVADHLATLQQPDGGFHYPEYWPPYNEVSLEAKCNIMLQFATWVAYARHLLQGATARAT